MTKETLIWAVFVSILCPLFLRSSGDPILLTAVQIGACLAAVAWGDRIERSPAPDTRRDQHGHVTVGMAADSNGKLEPFVQGVTQQTSGDYRLL